MKKFLFVLLASVVAFSCKNAAETEKKADSKKLAPPVEAAKSRFASVEDEVALLTSREELDALLSRGEGDVVDWNLSREFAEIEMTDFVREGFFPSNSSLYEVPVAIYDGDGEIRYYEFRVLSERTPIALIVGNAHESQGNPIAYVTFENGYADELDSLYNSGRLLDADLPRIVDNGYPNVALAKVAETRGGSIDFGEAVDIETGDAISDLFVSATPEEILESHADAYTEFGLASKRTALAKYRENAAEIWRFGKQNQGNLVSRGAIVTALVCIATAGFMLYKMIDAAINSGSSGSSSSKKSSDTDISQTEKWVDKVLEGKNFLGWSEYYDCWYKSQFAEPFFLDDKDTRPWDYYCDWSHEADVKSLCTESNAESVAGYLLDYLMFYEDLNKREQRGICNPNLMVSPTYYQKGEQERKELLHSYMKRRGWQDVSSVVEEYSNYGVSSTFCDCPSASIDKGRPAVGRIVEYGKANFRVILGYKKSSLGEIQVLTYEPHSKKKPVFVTPWQEGLDVFDVISDNTTRGYYSIVSDAVLNDRQKMTEEEQYTFYDAPCVVSFQHDENDGAPNYDKLEKTMIGADTWWESAYEILSRNDGIPVKSYNFMITAKYVNEKMTYALEWL